MRLSDVLSSKPAEKYEKIEGFLEGKPLKMGKVKNIDIGNIRLNFFCKKCNKMEEFCLHNPQKSQKAHCIGINDHMVSIDCVLSCLFCGETIPVWFLVESKNEIYSQIPEIKVIKYSDKLSGNVSYGQSSKYIELFDAADKAYREGLGAGAVVYLRKIYEIIVSEIVKKYQIDEKLNFQEKLRAADKKEHIIPRGLDDRKYELFQALSNIIHGEFDENEALSEYPHLKELVSSIVENIQTNDKLKYLRKSINL